MLYSVSSTVFKNKWIINLAGLFHFEIICEETRGKTIRRKHVLSSEIFYLRQCRIYWYMCLYTKVRMSMVYQGLWIYECLSGGWKVSESMWRTQSSIIQCLVKCKVSNIQEVSFLMTIFLHDKASQKMKHISEVVFPLVSFYSFSKIMSCGRGIDLFQVTTIPSLIQPRCLPTPSLYEVILDFVM